MKANRFPCHSRQPQGQKSASKSALFAIRHPKNRPPASPQAAGGWLRAREHPWGRASSPLQPDLPAFRQPLPLIPLLSSVIWTSAPSLCASSSPIARGIRAAPHHWRRHVLGDAAPPTHTPCQPALPQKPRMGCSARRLGQGVAVTRSCDLGSSVLPAHGDTLQPRTETPHPLPGSIPAALLPREEPPGWIAYPIKTSRPDRSHRNKARRRFCKTAKGGKKIIFYRPIFHTDRQLFESQSAL